MKQHGSEPSWELKDIESHTVADSEAAVNDRTDRRSNLSPNSRASILNTPSDRPRVRFHNTEHVVDATEAQGVQDSPGPSRAQNLRPTLSRNTDSFGSISGDVADESLRSENLTSTAIAAHRAHTAAIGAWHDSTSQRRWSTNSEAPTEAGSASPMTEPYVSQSRRVMSSDNHDLTLEAEAEGLLRAHTRHLDSPLRHVSDNTSQTDLDPGLEGDQDYVSSGHGRGGVFYQLLQAYHNPVYDTRQDHQPTNNDTTGSSGAATPTRRKWYEQEKAMRSQDTIADLAKASIRLANPNERTSAVRPEARRRRGHKRTTSGRIMSMMGLDREEEVKITIHVADILKRQQYIVKMCRALMLFGAPTHRLEEYLAMSARVLEIDSQFLYIPDCMVISFDDVLTHTTEVRIVRTAQSVNLGKLKDVHDVYKEVLHDVISLDDALSRLDQIIKAEPLYPVWVCVLMYGLASAAVSCFFKARLVDLPIIFAMGTLLGFLQLVVAPRSKTYNTVFEVSAAILFSFLARAFGSIRGGNLFCFSAITQGSIAIILPGWLVLSSALELHSKAMVPGAIRLVYAIIYSLFLVYGITVGTALYGAVDSNAVTETTCQNPLNPYWNFLFVPLYIIFITFTVQAKWTQMPAMVVIALAGYTVNFFTAQRFAASPSIAYTFGAFAIGVLANLYSRIRHGVAAAVLLPAVYIQVPGSIASTNAITSGLVTAANLTSSKSSPTSATDTSQINASVFNVAASMIQIAIGITVGLLMSALVVYPTGKRRSGLWTL
ncbi:hypothetical protein F4777DRAFT_295875 [Nemania sp. FL0916]|nr:hypothetical protein F4777DRAFT_295875 [Nemania sp. FL0916]